MNNTQTILELKVLFVSSSGKNIKVVPFIESQYEL